MTAFTTLLWAATNYGAADHVALDQVKWALLWLVTLCKENMQPVWRRCRRRSTYFTLITFDGSLSGGGATLQVGLRDLSEATTSPIVSCWQYRWDPTDFALLQLRPGDPGGQARVEAYTLLLALCTWQPVLTESQGTLAILGDALGVLYDVMKLKAKDPVLNAVAAEMALVLAPLGMDVRVAHLWTQRNQVCDMLSRLNVDSHQLPDALSRATKVSLRKLEGSILQSLR